MDIILLLLTASIVGAIFEVGFLWSTNTEYFNDCKQRGTNKEEQYKEYYSGKHNENYEQKYDIPNKGTIAFIIISMMIIAPTLFLFIAVCIFALATTNKVDAFAIVMILIGMIPPLHLTFLNKSCTKYFSNVKDVYKSTILQEAKEKSLRKYNWAIIIKIVVSLIPIAFIVLTYMNAEYTYSAKPIIYLYPDEKKKIKVKLGNKQQITTSYPKYEDGWNVQANPNGNLLDLDTNKQLYSLYYENENTYKFKIEKEGFIIKGKEVAEFLEEKLEILGLNSKEKEEFIIYWLPQLEKNKYNYIRFASKEEIDINMPLEIEPMPQTIIRVLMTYKPLNHPIKVKEQKLTAVERMGYTVIEWGGTKITI